MIIGALDEAFAKRDEAVAKRDSSDAIEALIDGKKE